MIDSDQISARISPVASKLLISRLMSMVLYAASRWLPKGAAKGKIKPAMSLTKDPFFFLQDCKHCYLVHGWKQRQHQGCDFRIVSPTRPKPVDF